MMRSVFYCALLCCLCLLAGCAANSTETSPQSARTQSATTATTTTATDTPLPQSTQANAVDAASSVNEQRYVASQNAMTNYKAAACALLTSAEIDAVQGEVAADIKGNDRENGGLTVSQCFYTLPTFSKSISLQLTRNASGKGNSDAVREFWNQSFHRGRDKDNVKDKDRDKDKNRGQDREEEEENKVPPQRVQGLGREAFWVRGGVAAALYVLKNDNAYFRLSLGGADADPIKLDKAKKLAQKALKRL